jgi:hypothetical protein
MGEMTIKDRVLFGNFTGRQHPATLRIGGEKVDV